MSTLPSSFVRASSVYFILSALVLVLATGYGVFKFSSVQNYTQAIAASEDIRRAISATLQKQTQEFDELAESHRVKDQEFRRRVVSILPPDENYTDLTRVFDEYFSAHDTPGNPIFQSSLRFGKNTPADGFPGISVLPITMNIEASRDNFLKFIEFIGNSGSFDTGVRLMAIHSIQINFPDEGEILQSARQNINFTVEMQAYHETPKIPR